MGIMDYLRIAKRNWVLILGCTLLGVLISGAATLLVKPTYTAETQLFVAVQNNGSISELQQGSSFSQTRVQSYVKTVTTPTVLQPVIDSLGLPLRASELAKHVSATTDLNTVLISISVEDNSPVQAAAIAQAVGDSLIQAVDKLEAPSKGGESPVKLSTVTPASAPSSPSGPNTRLYLAVGFVIGLGLGAGLSVVRHSVDNRIRGESDLRRVSQASLLGSIAIDVDASKNPLITEVSPQSPRAESFRQLRTNLHFANVSRGSKTIMVTSSLPGEGKTTTAMNLAISLSHSGQTVALVDADLRRPMVAENLGLEGNAGLTTALLGHADVNDLLQPWGSEQLYVLASGRIPPNPSELVGSDAMQSLVARLEEAFDTVIIDAPPLLPVTDAAVLAQHVGGVVMVVGAQSVRTTELEKALGALGLVNADLLGFVLNRVVAKGGDAYTYQYSSYSQPAAATSSANNSARVMDQYERPRRSGNTIESIDESFENFDDSDRLVRPRASSTFPGSWLPRK